jgi:hypothetical protein
MMSIPENKTTRKTNEATECRRGSIPAATKNSTPCAPVSPSVSFLWARFQSLIERYKRLSGVQYEEEF